MSEVENRVAPEKGVAKNAVAKSNSFVYLASDTTKSPVDFQSQPVGTKLVLVTPSGLEYEVVAGTSQIKSELSTEELTKLEKMKKWDSPKTSFPNLKISREG